MNTKNAEHDIVAAILAAGMLPVLLAPSEPGTVSAEERKAILGTVQHALGFMRPSKKPSAMPSCRTTRQEDRPAPDGRGEITRPDAPKRRPRPERAERG